MNKSMIILAAIVAVAFSATLEENLWMNWKQQHGKRYHSEQEELHRFAIFKNNLMRVQNWDGDFEISLNKFADMSDAEYRARNTYKSGRGYHYPGLTMEHVSTGSPLPASVDWRTKGVVNPIKDQGQCGSCWTFSATAAIESAYAISTGTLYSLSEQQIVDCAGILGNDGCNGGDQESAMEYIILARGQETEKEYPYTAEDGTCKYSHSLAVASISGVVNMTSGNETALAEAVAFHGPVAVAIDASHFSFQLYTSGVYYQKNCMSAYDDLDHAVAVVGYGVDTTTNQNYWIVRNSWGTDWGIQGYIWMAKDRNNNCGIATEPGYPIV